MTGMSARMTAVSPVTPEKEEPLHADEILRDGDALVLSYKAGRIWLCTEGALPLSRHDGVPQRRCRREQINSGYRE